MKFKNLKAGYICDAIAKVVNDFRMNKENEKEIHKINGLLDYVSAFDVCFPNDVNIDFNGINSILAVANNICTRGLPTRVPLLVEETFVQCELIKPNAKEFEFDFFETESNVDFQTIFELLHILEPELNIPLENYAGQLGSDEEWYFLNKTLSDFTFAKQILHSEREFATINRDLGGGRRVDFSYEFPYQNNETEVKKKGVIFEYDGKQHKLSSYKYYDIYRDDIAADKGFDTLRQSSNEITINPKIENQFRQEVFQIFQNNYKRNVNEFLKEYTILFVPLVVARIQKTLIEYLLRHPKLIGAERLKIAIIERDIPGGALAIKCLSELLEKINSLLQENKKVPQLEAIIFANHNWVYNDGIHLDAEIQDDEYFNQNDFDIILDHSILKRSNIYKEDTLIRDGVITIRSAHYVDRTFGTSRRTYCGKLLKYKSLVRKNDNGSFTSKKELEPIINHFIQNIFRKKEFREGQLPIISRAIQQKPVIGLLPTGGGKSLTFQLSAFLQPGLCLVVDPIKSLMEDQVRVLKQNWIDCCDYINSNLDSNKKREKLIDFRYGESMFLFVSPERFVMDEFRTIIQNIDASAFGLSFSYCVIDEVHCVSEWGHDFRATYLMLGKNAQQFCKTESNQEITLVGLTATASFDVLADIERELSIQSSEVSDALIMIENTIRPELFFRVIDITNQNRMDKLNADFGSMGSNLDKLNTEDILRQSQLHHFEEFDRRDFATAETVNNEDETTLKFQYNPNYLLQLDNLQGQSQNAFYSIVFCPVRGLGDNIQGVNYVYQNLNSTSKGYFYSSDGDDKLNEEVQQHFSDFTSNRTKHIICTKAFGLGIDKADIRSTYHFVYSGSLESLVQEAGRAGRDRKISEATILLSKNISHKLSHICFRKENPDDTELSFISDKFHRKVIRRDLLGQNFESEIILQNSISTTINNLKSANDQLKETYITRLNRFISKSYADREIHDFFFNGSFKGIDTEKSQFYNLFRNKEFTHTRKDKWLQKQYNCQNKTLLKFNFWQGKNGLFRLYIENNGKQVGYIDLSNNNTIPHQNTTLISILEFSIQHNNNETNLIPFFQEKVMLEIPEQETLITEYNQADTNTFEFVIAKNKIYPDSSKEICELIEVTPDNEINPPNFTRTYKEQVQSAFRYSFDFEDFILMLKEIGNDVIETTVDQKKRRLRFIYNRDREFKPNNDTGRLIYRMHSMGFLIDYEIDYAKNNLYNCTFRKYDTIDRYIEHIEDYLRRYLSENSAEEQIEILRQSCNEEKSTIDNILECLYFLSEFAYKEIADKRRRATDEIETILNTSITEIRCKNDWFEQNKYLKEQIYFYFNAKYARIGFKINGEPFSLLDDFQANDLNKYEILMKYLSVFTLEGTEQNNYKHMIGSCKKILRSLSSSDLKNEWLLRLLKAFAMYSVNNQSYISEANGDLEKGFLKLYSDSNYHQNNYERIRPIFQDYFVQLRENINPDNQSIKSIEIIHIKLLLKLQQLEIENCITTNQILEEELCLTTKRY